MLPQIKRPGHDAGSASGNSSGHARSGRDDGEVEIEVVDVRNVDGSNVSDDDPTMLASNAAFRNSARPSARPSAAPLPNLQPSHLKKGVFGDEPTQLMPVKKNAAMPQPDRTPGGSSRPAARASARPGANSSLPEARGPARSSRSNGPGQSSNPSANQGMPKVPAYSPPPSFKMRDQEESKTSMRPLGALSEEAKKVLQESKAAASAMAVPSAGAIKAQVDAARAKRLSDQRQRAAETLEVTPVSISERFVVQGRPAAPWAIAFVAMGIFAGITTAVFTGGRASAIAAFIDPAHEAPAAAAAAGQPNAVAAVAPVANDPAANFAQGAQPTPPPAVTGAPIDVAPMTPTVFAVGRASQTQAAAQPQPAPTQAPVQVAHATPKADPPAQRSAPVAATPKPDPKPAAVAAAPAPDPKPASSHHSKKGAASGGGDVDSAAAADALAKAQLENSL